MLSQAGYNPGDDKNFYGSNIPTDTGAEIIYDRWKDQPTDQDLIDAGLDPTSVSTNPSKISISAYLEKEMAERGIDQKSSYGRFVTTGYGGQGSGPGYGSGTPTLQDYRQDMDELSVRIPSITKQSNILDMMEWDLIKKKKEEESEVSSGGNYGTTATVTGSTFGGSGYNPQTGGGTGTGTPPSGISTPYINPVTPVYKPGQTGTSETPIPTYEAGLGKQATQFADRATCQASFYQPQTQAEKEAAGTAPSFENVLYRNRFGMSMYVQHINGVASQPIPPGYSRVEQFTAQNQVQGKNQGGMIQSFMGGGVVSPTTDDDGRPQFRIWYASNGTYSGLYNSEAQAQAKIDADNAAAGYSSEDSNTGGGSDQSTEEAADAEENALPLEATVNQDFITGQQTVTEEDLAQQQRNLAAQVYVAPGGAVAASPTSYIDPNAAGTVLESTAGQAQATAPMVESDQVAQIETATTADTPQKIGAAQVDPNLAFSDVQNATNGMTAAQMTGGPTQTIDAAQDTATSVSSLDAETGTAKTVAESQGVDGTVPTRTLDTTAGSSELITGTGVDQSKVLSAFGEGEIKAASVQDELTGLMQQFEGGNTPAWAAGSMRSAMATLAARGLGASSMAGQAVIQAAMEASLPIAQIDAGNKQQMALFKGEQRAKFLQMDFDQAFQAKVMNAAKVSEIANMNFTAEQQIALENSRAANTMELQNLSNKQALVLAEASALSGMDMSNLNNRQQANVQNAQNFLQLDMANLNNEQQTALFKQQSLVNSLLTDQAAANAAAQFNASSENQTNQFFANLSSSIGQFNAAQMNAMKQFNAGEVNSLLEFNASIQNQRELFNAQNYLVVAQANAQWRQNLTTLNTAGANETSMDYAKTVNALTMASLDQIWQKERDAMDYAFTNGENQADRALSLLLGDMELESVRSQINAQEDSALGALLTKIFFKV
tara:strand:- start:3482 stop:6319 length:2838 start_codon:yes stop_codon:yes gene_type:complete